MALRIDFYNAIAQVLTYPETNSFDFEPNDEEKMAIQRLQDVLGRLYYAPPCPKLVSTYYQSGLAELLKIDPNSPLYKQKFLELSKLDAPVLHEDCPCIRSEKHDSFHRCKHGYYGT